ncbi:MAG: hypothetical protein H7Y38_00950, partial [Armatimonadetes bacterium]|nr:hypothetical protein [Armatimonadota bacterium]
MNRAISCFVPMVVLLFVATSVAAQTVRRAAPIAGLGDLTDRAEPVALLSSGNTAFYLSADAGTTRSIRINTCLELSDGTIVVGGSAGDAAQFEAFAQKIPVSKRTVLSYPAGSLSNNAGTGRVGFLLHLSADLSTPLDIQSFPAGAIEEVRHLKQTNAVGTRTGVLFLSGTLKSNNSNGGGYFVARLDNNYVKKLAAPQSLLWARSVNASTEYADTQPWDVGNDGRVVYAWGKPFDANWCAVQRLTPDGADDVVPDWRYHRVQATAPTTMPDGKVLKVGDFYEGEFTPATGVAGVRPVHSAIVFKSTGRIQLRSWTQAQYAANLPDGNGRTKQGTWPMDVFFSGPGNPSAPGSSPGGPGYTGYRLGGGATQRVGGIAVDRRTNHIYIGFSIQSRLPDNTPDIESAVLAMSHTVALKWWSRLYAERDANGATQLST